MPAPQALSHVSAIKPYVPGRPIEDVMREFGLSEVLKLASNESPFGTAQGVKDAYVNEADKLWLYPDNDAYSLTRVVAERHRVAPEQVVFGTGSSHLLELAARAYATQGDEIVFPDHGFICYPLFTQAVGAAAVRVPEVDLTADVDGLLNALTERTKILFIANPNNPTGTAIDEVAFRRLMEGVPPHVLVVLDEAYAEYALEDGIFDGTKLVNEYNNLLVTRTFSKAYGLSALRVGYGVGSAEIISVLSRLRPPFSVSTPALKAAEVAFQDTAFTQSVVEKNKAERVRMAKEYEALGLLACPSHANFLLIDTSTIGKDPNDLFTDYQKQGVIVRPVKANNLTHHLRVSIGLSHENDRCLEVIKASLPA